MGTSRAWVGAVLLTVSCGPTEPAAGQVWQLSFGSGKCGTPSVQPLRLITPTDPAPPWAGRMSTLSGGRSVVDLVTPTAAAGESVRLRGVIVWGGGTEVLLSLQRGEVTPSCEATYAMSSSLVSTSGGAPTSSPADAGRQD